MYYNVLYWTKNTQHKIQCNQDIYKTALQYITYYVVGEPGYTGNYFKVTENKFDNSTSQFQDLLAKNKISFQIAIGKTNILVSDLDRLVFIYCVYISFSY